ncbi:unnamed protein product [Dibothriocephalus latus]|uniref:Uncharacterized protein n=1 Tax=Dibothriocephalus latus TaxID=60516 RepID=A0A3P7QPS9_DIBLA|nr:unnamed protein product [Dibothriocephalus latus]
MQGKTDTGAATWSNLAGVVRTLRQLPQYLRRVFRENGYPCYFVNRCLRKRDGQQKHADPKIWRSIPYVENVSKAVGRLLAPLAVGVAHRPEAVKSIIASGNEVERPTATARNIWGRLQDL